MDEYTTDIDVTVWVAFRTAYYADGWAGEPTRVGVTFSTRDAAEAFAMRWEENYSSLSFGTASFRTWTFAEFAPIPF